MRLFFGLQMDPASRIAMADWRDRMLPPLDRPVPASNLHITLNFLGDIEPARLESIESQADDVRAPAFDLLLDELGYFSKPGILWIGPSDVPGALEQLSDALNQLARRERIKTEKRKYQPHVTLARRCSEPPPASAVPPRFHLRFDSFVLFESVSGKQGVQYRAFAEWPLTGG